jgi:hypothetical protein
MPPAAPPDGMIRRGKYIQGSKASSMVRMTNESRVNGMLAPRIAGSNRSFSEIFDDFSE